MLGKDYMLAIILVNCDGVHRGSGWEDQKPRGDEGRLPEVQTPGGGGGWRLGDENQGIIEA